MFFLVAQVVSLRDRNRNRVALQFYLLHFNSKKKSPQFAAGGS
jgi:hypothetical protein